MKVYTTGLSFVKSFFYSRLLFVSAACKRAERGQRQMACTTHSLKRKIQHLLYGQACRAENSLLVVRFLVVPSASSEVFRAVRHGHRSLFRSSCGGNHISDFKSFAHNFSFLILWWRSGESNSELLGASQGFSQLNYIPTETLSATAFKKAAWLT